MKVQSLKLLMICVVILTLTSCLDWATGKKSPPREPSNVGSVYENDNENGTQDNADDDNGGEVDTETIEE